MNTVKLSLAGLVIGLLVCVLSSCATPPDPAGTPEVVVVPSAPPPPPVEVVPAAPGPEYIWVDGYWGWHGRWIWEPGRWAVRPHARAAWVPGRWSQGRRGWNWE